MKTQLSDLHDHELLAILEYKDLANLQKSLVPDMVKNSIPSNSYHKTLRTLNFNTISESFVETADNASYPCDIIWTLISLVSMAAAVMLSGVAAGIVLAVSLGSFCIGYKARKRQQLADKDFLQLATVHIAAIDLLLEREHIQLDNTRHYERKPITVSKTAAVGMGITGGFLMSVFYFLAVTDSLTMLGLLAAASVVTGPIGWGIALGLSIGIGIFVGVKHYQTTKHKKMLKDEINLLTKEIEDKKNTYHVVMQDRGNRPVLTESKHGFFQTKTVPPKKEKTQRLDCPATGFWPISEVAPHHSGTPSL